MISTFYTEEEVQEKNVIDDFAKYIARNGVECELMTQHKQQGNPIFAFLFGGRLSDYYRHKLDEERSILQNEEYSYQRGAEYTENNTVHSYTTSSNQFQHGYDQTEYFQENDDLNTMRLKLDQERVSLQMMQEEHYRLLSESQQHLNDESINTNKEKIVKCMMIVDIYRLYQAKKQCEDSSIDFDSMEKCMQAILINCTKDNICSGKNWVIENCTKANNHYPLCMYLLAKVSISTEFNERLHIVYFINDLLHHCKRKNSANLLEALESVIVHIYSLCVLLADEDGKTKLNKVLSLWETNSYIKRESLDSMRQNHVNPILYLDHWFDNEINMMKRGEDDGVFRDVNLPNEDTIGRYQSDAKMKIGNLEANHNQLKYELKIKEEAIQLAIYEHERDIKLYEMEARKLHEESLQHDYNCFQENQMPHNVEYPFHMPDISRPPPGFSVMDLSQCEGVSDANLATMPMIPPDSECDIVQEKLIIPYWRLPAALMVAHIRLSQFEYKSIDPTEIKMPQLRPPSKRLIDISNTFYQLPSHDRPRDTEGWERLGLHDFLKAKEKAKIGEITDDFVNSLHLDKDDEDDYDYGCYDDGNTEMDYRNYDDVSDFRRNFPPPGTLNNEYRHPGTLQHFGPTSTNFSTRMNNQRSLLGSPWEDNYQSKQFPHNVDVGPSRSSFSYNSTNNRPPHLQASTPRMAQQKIVPLMSLGLPTNMKRQGGSGRSKRSTFHRNSDDDSYNDRQRSSRRRYVSRSRSRSRSRSLSHSRSRSQSSAYSRSRSRSYSRSRSNSRSRSRSSHSSRSSGKRPYKGGFIAKKRSKSRTGSRSRSLSRSPKRPNYDANYNASSLMQNLPDRRVWSGMRSELINPGTRSELINPDTRSELINPGISSQMRNEDPFSRFRQQKSSGYSEWMKERVVRRSFEEDAMDNF